MKKIPLEKLSASGIDLDLFIPGDMDSELLTQGLYVPLPLSGSRLIWGHNIIREAAKLGINALICKEYPWMCDFERLKTALRLENRAGKYTWEEKEKIFNYVSHIYENDPLEGEKVFCKLSPLLEGNRDPGLSRKYGEYLALDENLKQLVKKNVINYKTAREVAGLPGEVFRLFSKTAHQKRLSFSQRRIFLTCLFEISRRDRLKEGEIITLFKKLMEDPEPVDRIKSMRYPRITELEEKLEGFSNHHLKGSGIKLKAPDHFEGDSFSLTLSITRKNIGKKLEILKKIEENGDELFDLL